MQARALAAKKRGAESSPTGTVNEILFWKSLNPVWRNGANEAELELDLLKAESRKVEERAMYLTQNVDLMRKNVKEELKVIEEFARSRDSVEVLA